MSEKLRNIGEYLDILQVRQNENERRWSRGMMGVGLEFAEDTLAEMKKRNVGGIHAYAILQMVRNQLKLDEDARKSVNNKKIENSIYN